uniref:Uncharacterized protein n=1 Tax=Setaria digitata TaxID=48799 RepID=A0A915PZ96_9BILA
MRRLGTITAGTTTWASSRRHRRIRRNKPPPGYEEWDDDAKEYYKVGYKQYKINNLHGITAALLLMDENYVMKGLASKHLFFAYKILGWGQLILNLEWLKDVTLALRQWKATRVQCQLRRFTIGFWQHLKYQLRGHPMYAAEMKDYKNAVEVFNALKEGQDLDYD